MRKIDNKTFTSLQDCTSAFYKVIEHLDDLLDRGGEYFDARSEGWQESDKGSDYEHWMALMENAQSEVQAALDSVEAVTQTPEE
tara:strand:- start:898 stop:1149 length:252 start_codon:yes stop_codon:yes gene_type:complete